MEYKELKNLLAELVEAQLHEIEAWHEREPEEPEAPSGGPSALALRRLVMTEHLVNFRLWHVEDEARREDAGPEVIADCKRGIDALNQRRNDLIERIDSCIVGLVEEVPPAGAKKRHNTETLGSALDRLSVISLKIYHMREQAGRAEAGEEHMKRCADRVRILEEQRADLIESVLWLVDEFARGEKTPRVYYQFKMYNDPALNPRLYDKKAGNPGD